MQKYLLITRPSYDTATHYISAWTNVGTTEAETYNFKLINLSKEKANKKEVESYLNSDLQIPFVVLNGHGNQIQIFGHDNKIIFSYGQNEDKLKDKVAFSIACSAASKFGQSAVDHGARAYVGYKEDFAFYNDENMESRPLQDEVAALFLAHAQIFVSSLIKGNSVKVAYEKAKKSLFSSLQAALSGNNNVVASTLFWDYTNFVKLGEDSTQI